MSFDYCVFRRDIRRSIGGFHSFQLPSDTAALLDSSTRIRRILASNPRMSASYSWLIEHVLGAFLQGADPASVICGPEDDLVIQGHETVFSIELFPDPGFLTAEVRDALVAQERPNRRGLSKLRQLGRDHGASLRALSLPSAMMQAPDSRLGDSFMLLSRRTREAYELGTGAGWRSLQGGRAWLNHLADSILRLYSTELEGGLEWASGCLYCFIESLAGFVSNRRNGDLDVVLLDEAPSDIEILGSRYDLGQELQHVIADYHSVLRSIWGAAAR